MIARLKLRWITQTAAVVEASVPTPPVRRQAVGSIVADETPAAGSAQANPVSPASTLLIRATSPSWVEIVRDDGQVVVSKLLRTGDQLTATVDEELYLETASLRNISCVDGIAYKSGNAPNVANSFDPEDYVTNCYDDGFYSTNIKCETTKKDNSTRKLVGDLIGEILNQID